MRFRILISLLLWAMVQPLYAERLEPAGRVIAVSGSLLALSGNEPATRKLRRGARFHAGELLKTAVGSSAQLRFKDGSLFALGENTEFRVEQFNYSEENRDEDVSVNSLVKGSMRAITGAIGKRNPEAVTLNTPVATIGIRGTTYEAVYNRALQLAVWQGGVRVNNRAGGLNLGVGGKFNFAQVDGLDARPRGLMKPPAVFMGPPARPAPIPPTEEPEPTSGEPAPAPDGGTQPPPDGTRPPAPPPPEGDGTTQPPPPEGDASAPLPPPPEGDALAPLPPPPEGDGTAPLPPLDGDGTGQLPPPPPPPDEGGQIGDALSPLLNPVATLDPTDTSTGIDGTTGGTAGTGGSTNFTDLRLTSTELASLDRIGIVVFAGAGAREFLGGKATDGAAGSPIFVDNGLHPGETGFATAPAQFVVRQGLAASGGSNTFSPLNVSWGVWNGNTNPIRVHHDGQNPLLFQPEFRPAFWITGIAPIKSVIDGHQIGGVTGFYSTMVHAQGGGSGGMVNTGNTTANITVNFSSGAVGGNMLISNSDNWVVNFAGTLVGPTLDIPDASINGSVGGVNGINGKLGLVLVGPNANGVGGVFDLQKNGVPTTHVEGIIVVEDTGL